MMKKIFSLMTFLLVAFFAQAQFPTYPTVKQSLGSKSTEVYSKGILSADSGYVQSVFPDTVSANRGYIKNIAGITIRVADTVYFRNAATTKWISFYSVSGGILARNGATLSGSYIELGGTLNRLTTISGAGYDFTLSGTGETVIQANDELELLGGGQSGDSGTAYIYAKTDSLQLWSGWGSYQSELKMSPRNIEIWSERGRSPSSSYIQIQDRFINLASSQDVYANLLLTDDQAALTTRAVGGSGLILEPHEISLFTSDHFLRTNGNPDQLEIDFDMDFQSGVKLTGAVSSHNTADSMLVMNQSTKLVGYRPIPAGNPGTVTSVTGTSPISVATGTTTPVISIADAAADGSTKGAATYTASDFNSSSGLISLDYTNGQAASGSTKGFLTAADWTTFNSKGSGTVTGTGTTNTMTKWTSSTAIGNSSVTDDGSVLASSIRATIATSVTTPIDYGGSGTTSTKEINATSSGSATTGANITFKSGTTTIATMLNNGNVGIGVSPSSELLEVGKNQNALTYIKTINTTNGTGAGSGFFASGTGGQGVYFTYQPTNYTDVPSWANKGTMATSSTVEGFVISAYKSTGVVSIETGGIGGSFERFRVAANGSVGIGTTSPAASALLDITSTTKMLLPPRMTGTQKNAISSPADGGWIYQNATDNGKKGFYGRVDGAFLRHLTTADSTAIYGNFWKLTGNADIDSSVNWFGTNDPADSDPIMIRVAGDRWGQLGGGGTGNDGNIAIGYKAFAHSSGNTPNVAIGYEALEFNTSGQYNNAFGAGTLTLNTTGSFNTAIGYDALGLITTGSNNTGVGKSAGVGIGNGNLTYATAIGAATTVTQSHSIILGHVTDDQVGIGVTAPVASAKLQVQSTTQGFLPPRQTTAQRTGISSPAEGLCVYDTDLHKLYVFDGTVWQAAW